MDDWLWFGGRLCLDFVNTLRDRWAQPNETLRDLQDVQRWLQAAKILDAEAAVVPAGLLDNARGLREAMDRAILAGAAGRLPDEADVTIINTAAQSAPQQAVQLAIRDSCLVADYPLEGAHDVTAALAVLAHDAIELLLSSDARRVRVCSGTHCALRYLDRSRAGNRRWCSMTRCGNRAKAQAHYRRSQSG